MNGKVSMKDIASSLNITVDAVSKALRDSPEISSSTKDKVRQKAQELGYVKNSLAVSLKTGTTKNVAVFVNDLYNPYFAIMVYKIIRLLDKEGYTGVITLSNGYDLRMSDLSAFFTNKCSMAISLVQPTDEVAKTFADNSIPLFVIGIKPTSESVNYAITDDYSGGQKVGKFFLSKGFKKAIYLTNSPSETTKRRYNGFNDFLSPIIGSNVDYLRFDFEGKTLSDAAKLIKGNGYDFVFCHSDYVAILLRRVLKEQGSLNGIYLMGYDNVSQYVDLYDPVSSIGADDDELVKEVVDTSIAMHTGARCPTQLFHKVFPVELVER